MKEQIEANRVYLRFFISGYLLIIIIIGSLTIFKVKKRLDNQSLQHKLLLRKMSQITITHTCVYALLLIWQIVSPFLIYNNSINILMTVSDMVSRCHSVSRNCFLESFRLHFRWFIFWFYLMEMFEQPLSTKFLLRLW